MIPFACGQCQEPLAADPAFAGNPVACPACGMVTTVPRAESPLARATRSPEELKERLEGTRAAFAALPFYMLGLLLTLVALWASFPKHNFATLKLGFYLALPLAGVGWLSVKCLQWLSTKPFRAVAVGRKLYVIYCVLWATITLAEDWPAPKWEAVEGAVQLIMPNTLTYLGFFFTFASGLAAKIAILAFLGTAYAMLRAERPDYSWRHFWQEVTFGFLGKMRYDWREPTMGGVIS